MNKPLRERKIALALSGGGYRAATFHLGMLKKLAECGLLEQVAFISTVSGGSLLVGLIYSLNNNKWPTSDEFLSSVYERAKDLLTQTGLEKSIVLGFFIRPDLWWRFGWPGLTARALQKKWGVNGNVSQLTESPRWIINATTYETGKNFRIMPRRMGDYVLGYADKPEIPLAAAMAASAGFPILIGPYVLRASGHRWFKYESDTEKATVECPYKKVHLWDGGVYDNLGIEALFKTNRAQFRDGFDFLIVSDGSLPLGVNTSRKLFSRANRLVEIATSQVRNLMVRSVIKYLSENPYSGAFLQIGNSAKRIIELSPRKAELVEMSLEGFLDDTDAKNSSALSSRLKPTSLEISEKLLRHGWEVAHVTLGCYCGDYFLLENKR